MSELTPKNSRVVYLKRLPASIPESGAEGVPELMAYFANSYRAVGSFFPKNSMRPGTGISLTDENLLLPYVLNIDSTDRDFRMRVTDFYHAITTKVEPHDVNGVGGTRLEIGLDNNEEPMSKDNLPLNAMDYIRYKQVLGHPEVAASKADGKGNSRKLYYIDNPLDVNKIDLSVADQKDAAMEAYFTIKKDPNKIVQYLMLLGTKNLSTIKGKEQVTLRNLAMTEPKNFLDVHLDKEKDAKYLIKDLVIANILELAGSIVLIKENREQIGGNEKEAVAYIRNPTNSKQIVILRSMLQQWKKSKNTTIEDLDDEVVPPKSEINLNKE